MVLKIPWIGLNEDALGHNLLSQIFDLASISQAAKNRIADQPQGDSQRTSTTPLHGGKGQWATSFCGDFECPLTRIVCLQVKMIHMIYDDHI